MSLDFTSSYKKTVDDIVDKKWNNAWPRNHIQNSQTILEITPALCLFLFFFCFRWCGLIKYELPGVLGGPVYAFGFLLNHTCNSSKTWSHNPYHKIVSFSTCQFVCWRHQFLLMSSLFLYTLTDLWKNRCSLKCNHSQTNNDFLVLICFVKLTPLGSRPGLGTPPRYEGLVDLQVEYVKYAVISIRWVRLSPQ